MMASSSFLAFDRLLVNSRGGASIGDVGRE